MKRYTKITVCLFLIILLPIVTARDSNKHKAAKFHVGVLLDLDTVVGKMAQTSIAMAVEDFYVAHPDCSTSLVLHTKDTKQDDVEATFAALDLLQITNTEAIIGPQKSTQAVVVSEIGNRSQVPVISFSATSPTLSSVNLPYFVRTTIDDTAQVTTIISLVKAYGWREVVPICDDNDFGRGIIPYLADELQQIDVKVPYRSLIPVSFNDDQIQNELLKLQTRMQARVYVVHMSSSRGSILFLNAKRLGMMNESYIWIMTNGITNMVESFDPSIISAMRDALGVRLYVPETPELSNFTIRWKKRFQDDYPQETYGKPSIYALYAYDTIYALATAVENARFTDTENAKPSKTSETLNVFPNGPELLEALYNVTIFQGLSGNFSLVNGQLQYLAFQIINVVGQGIREIGYWREKQGFSKQLDAVSSDKNYSTLSRYLNGVVCPGESTVTPKGWEISINGKKLRVGVVTSSYKEFIEAEEDPETHITTARGYAVDIFEEAINKLPYSVPYEYELFDLSKDYISLSYNDFVYQVYPGNYDIAIGDITIRYNSTFYADFSVPYSNSGVAMIVPVKKAPKNAFLFLMPLSFGLWFGSTVFLIFAGITIWLMEFRSSSKDSISKRLGEILQLSLFASQDQDKLKSILSKIVATASAGILLVLTSSYTASLTSMLTVQQLQPTVTDIHDLIKNGNYVGYGTGSFVEGLLEQMGFEKSKIRAYDDDKFGEALDSQSVAVVVHEAFPKGSPLVPDISKAILNITDGDDIIKISKISIEVQNCQDNSGFELDSKSLNFVSFWPPFAFNGAVCAVCLIIFYVRKKQRKMNIPDQDTGSIMPRIFPEAGDENYNNNPPPKV